MNELSSPTHEPLQGALFDPDALLAGQARIFDLDGRAVTVARTPDGLSVVSESGHAVVIRPAGEGKYTVGGVHPAAGAPVHDTYGAAMRLALDRLQHRAR